MEEMHDTAGFVTTWEEGLGVVRREHAEVPTRMDGNMPMCGIDVAVIR